MFSIVISALVSWVFGELRVVGWMRLTRWTNGRSNIDCMHYPRLEQREHSGKMSCPGIYRTVKVFETRTIFLLDSRNFCITQTDRHMLAPFILDCLILFDGITTTVRVDNDAWIKLGTNKAHIVNEYLCLTSCFE